MSTLKADGLNAFVLADSEKCTGCKTCEIACAIAHSEERTLTAGTASGPLIPRLFVMVTAEVAAPVQCRHCEDAPCANVCQMSAISRVDHRILVDTERCVGCKLCLMACPFGAIELVPQHRGTRPIYPSAFPNEEEWVGKKLFRANKCDLCAGRDEGPACVEICPEKALELIQPVAESKRRMVEAALKLLEMR